MKKATTLLIVGIFTLGNILTANAKTYRETQTNSEGQIETITLSDGDDQKVTEPLKQYRFSYNTKGELVAKVVYYWNSNRWVEHIAYSYQYNTTMQLVELQYTKWDKEKLVWCDTEFTTFPKIGNDKLLTVNYLDTIKY